MHFSVLTLFPEMFSALQVGGIVKRSVESRLISIETIDIRDFATDRHHTVDDRPYGGGCGMVMKPEPLAEAIRHAKGKYPGGRAVLLSPRGRHFDQQLAMDLAAGCSELILVCGRYEGIDERIYEQLIDDELSIGDYVLTGGELAAMVVIDAVSRLIPGTLGNECSAQEDSFSTGLLEHPQYTRPRSFGGAEVPKILLSGNHGLIEKWKRQASIIQTLLKRSDLLQDVPFTSEDLEFLEKLRQDIETITEKRPAIF